VLRALAALLVASSLLLVFQNCEEEELSDQIGPGTSPGGEVVEVEASDYVQLSHQYYSQDGGLQTLNVDLQIAQMSITDEDNNKATCDLPEETAREFADILSNVQICTPAPLEPGEVACLAIAVPDIELYRTDGSSEELAASICNTGRFLCGI
jgi:hypothetical protein